MHWIWRDPAQHGQTDRIAVEEQLPPKPAHLILRFLRADGGNFAIITALLMPVLLGVTALAVEYGHGLLSRATNQRVADIAAFTGALEYSKGQSEDAMRDSALHAASVNGIPVADVRVNLVPAPRGTGQAVHVRIVTKNTIVLGTILGAASELLVGAEAFAAIGAAGEPACVLALDGKQSGIILSGGTHLNANDCSVASNATIAVPCGTTITAKVVYYDTKAPEQGCSGIQKPGGTPGDIQKANTQDPLATHPTVLAASARIPQVVALTAPAPPAVPAAGAINFSWGNDANVKTQVAAAGCTATGAMPTWTVTCPDTGGIFTFGAITSSGATVQFDVGSTRPKTYRIAGAINAVSGGGITFGPGHYQVTQGITASGSAKINFGAGSYAVGGLAGSCSGHSVCATGSGMLSFTGSSSFTLTGGVYAGGGSTVTLGSGTGNRFALGPATDGNAISLGGGGTVLMGDALGADDSFRVKGHINNGGTCLMISAAPQHDIAGSLVANGALILGAGVYTVDGSFLLGGGGAMPCGGAVVSVRAIDVTLVLTGKTGVQSGACPNLSFCISGGYSNVVFTAPKTGATAGLAVVGPTNGSSNGASLAGGASGASISGAFYFPTGPIVMAGGAGLGGGGGDCLQLVGSRIELSGGASAASDCLGNGAGGNRKRVVLVQ